MSRKYTFFFRISMTCACLAALAAFESMALFQAVLGFARSRGLLLWEGVNCFAAKESGACCQVCAAFSVPVQNSTHFFCLQ